MKKKRFLKTVLLLDNYDSFTYNLKHLLNGLGCDVKVIRNDELEMDFAPYSHVILSPGPGLPKNAGVLMDLLKIVQGKIPVLGICLGMQAIGEHLNGRLYNQADVQHGVSEMIVTKESILFNSIENEFEVGLYHSWALDDAGEYEVVAKSKSGVIMAIENRGLKMYGVQFHPESIMTSNGKAILSNFLKN